MTEKHLHEALTSEIINRFYTVYNTLGYGFLENVYEKALKLELQKAGLNVDRQRKIEVFYGDESVGVYYADLLVNDVVIVEIKSAESICEDDEYQLINYLKATELEVGLLLNFGEKPEAKRRIFTNDFKNRHLKF